MKIYKPEKLLKDNCSRGVVIEAFDCVDYFVPKKSVKEFAFLCNQYIPEGLIWSVSALNCTSKKGNYAVLRQFDEKSISDSRKKFPEIFKKV